MTEPSELRGDVISREAAIEALETWIANQPDGHYFGAWAVAIYEAQKILAALPSVPERLSHDELQKAREIAGEDGCYFCALWFRKPFGTATPALPKHDFILAPSVPEPPNRMRVEQTTSHSCGRRIGDEFKFCPECGQDLLSGVPEPPNDARKICSCGKWADECAGWCANDTSVPVSSAPTGLTEQLEKLFADYPADFYGEAQDFKMEVRAILEYSSAPTGLTRERLDEMIDGIWKVEVGTPTAHERYGAQLLRDHILESSSAPTPETESDEIEKLLGVIEEIGAWAEDYEVSEVLSIIEKGTK